MQGPSAPDSADKEASSESSPEELRRLRLAVEASGEVIFMTDADGTMTYVNPELVRAIRVHAVGTYRPDNPTHFEQWSDARRWVRIVLAATAQSQSREA